MSLLSWKSPRNWPSGPTQFGFVCITITLLFSAVAMALNVADPDLWGHVHYGREAIKNGLPTASTSNYSAVGYRWINHENLAELGLALGMDLIGPSGMLIGKTLLGLGLIGLILRHGLRQGGSLLGVCLVSLLTAVNLAPFWSLRPQVMSCVSFGLLLATLEAGFSGWSGRCHPIWLDRQGDCEVGGASRTLSVGRLRWLWAIPFLFIFWTNSHGGFVAGLCILAFYLFARGIELLIESFSPAGNAELPLRTATRVLIGLATVLAASFAATAINPYGVGLHGWLLSSLGVPRPEIIEWQPPNLMSSSMLPFVLMMVIALAALTLTRRSRDLTHTVILLLTLWQSLEHRRHIAFFAIAFGFWIVPHVDSVLDRFRVRDTLADIFQRVPVSPLVRQVGRLALLGIVILVGARLMFRLSDVRVDRDQFPVAAIEYLATHDASGRIVVTYDWAQYVIAAFDDERQGRGLRVSFDGRFRTCYPQEVVDMNFDFVLGDDQPRFRSPQSPAFDETRVLEFGHPGLVLLDRRQSNSVEVMQSQSDHWVLLYQDAIAQVWGRRSVYDDPEVDSYIAPSERQISDEPQLGFASWPAVPGAWPSSLPVARISRVQSNER